MTVIETLGWVLLHFAWQGVVAAAALSLALLVTPSGRASLRYALGCAALLLMAAAPIATAMRLTASHVEPIAAEQARERSAVASAGAGSALVARPGESSAPASKAGTGSLRWVAPPSVADVVEPAIPWLVAGWALGVALLSVRLLGGWWHLRSLRTRSLSPVPPWCVEAISRLTGYMRITRPISFAVSLSVSAPVVIGHIKPLVLLPVAALSALSPSQLEAILAHELAHVRRHDYLVNLMQTVIETLLFYHPAVWWVSSRVRVLREHCCDDLAVAACGDRKGYVQALVGLERLRRQSPLLALGATDGPLFARARRVLGKADREVASPRLAAGMIALSVAVLALAGVSRASQEPAPSAVPNRTPQTTASAQMIAAPQQGGSLAERWAWSEREARSRRASRYWVGYSFRPVRELPPVVYFDRDAKILGDSTIAGDQVFFSGRVLGSGRNLIFPGRTLDIREADARAIKVLFALDGSGRTARLTRVHASAVPLPVDLRDLPVFWLGAADTTQSLERVDDLYARAPTIDLKQDLVATVAIHDDSARVVPWLERRVAGSDPDDIREEAAEGLARHPVKAALAALDRTARSDRSSKVRQEAAEALGDLNMPEATDALVSLAGKLQDVETRREAVEALGERADQRAREALGDLARQDPNREIQLEAIEALGENPDAEVLGRLRELAQKHADAEVRRQALETLAENLAPADAIAMLRQAVEGDRDVEVHREAVELLADLDDPRARAALIEVARSHKDAEVRAEAVESLGEAPSEDTAAVLAGIVRSEPDEDVREQAIETLAELPGGRGIAALIEIARTHADQRIRKQVLEMLVESDHPDARELFRRALEQR